MKRFILAGCLVVVGLVQTLDASIVNLVANKISSTATASSDNGTPSFLTDDLFYTQYDSSNTGPTSAIALTFGGLKKSFNKIFLYQTDGWVVKGFEVQVAKPLILSPNVNTDSDWQTVANGSFSGLSNTASNNGLPAGVFTFSDSQFSSGVRILATDKSNIVDNRMRTRELIVFDRYNNVAPLATATFNGGSWADPNANVLKDELISNQDFFTTGTGPGIVDFTWSTGQWLGSFMLYGGSGLPSELITNYSIQADLGAGLQTLFTHTGNSLKSTYDILGGPILTTHVRLIINNTDGSGGVNRVSEFFIFQAPEPSSFGMMVLGLMGFSRVIRRRKS